MIAGFCTETEEEHLDSLSLLEYVRFDYGFMFAYSERPGTLAAKKFADDIPADVKQRRLAEIIALQQRIFPRWLPYVSTACDIAILTGVIAIGAAARSPPWLPAMPPKKPDPRPRRMTDAPWGFHRRFHPLN